MYGYEARKYNPIKARCDNEKMYTDSFLMFITTYKGCNAEELRNNDDKPRRFNTGPVRNTFHRYRFIYIYTSLCVSYLNDCCWKKKKEKKKRRDKFCKIE